MQPRGTLLVMERLIEYRVCPGVDAAVTVLRAVRVDGNRIRARTLCRR
jgi:hypothetical protein